MLAVRPDNTSNDYAAIAWCNEQVQLYQNWDLPEATVAKVYVNTGNIVTFFNRDMYDDQIVAGNCPISKRTSYPAQNRDTMKI